MDCRHESIATGNEADNKEQQRVGFAKFRSTKQQQQLTTKYNFLIEEGYLQHPVGEKVAGKRVAIKKSKTQKLLECFKNHREDIIRFITDVRVLFGNNITEQAIRMMKVKQIISDCFRSKEGATSFANIRSYVDTIRKTDFCMIYAIGQAIAGNPISPFADNYTINILVALNCHKKSFCKPLILTHIAAPTISFVKKAGLIKL